MNTEWLSHSQKLAQNCFLASQEISSILSQRGYLKKIGTSLEPTTVVTCLEQFQECVRYLNTRRSKGAGRYEKMVAVASDLTQIKLIAGSLKLLPNHESYRIRIVP